MKWESMNRESTNQRQAMETMQLPVYQFSRYACSTSLADGDLEPGVVHGSP